MTILLVDDNEISLELQKLMIESYGLSVDTATSGTEAIDLASKKQYSVIFMDIRMSPDMDGFTAAEKIRLFDKTVPIIALSADKIPKDDKRFWESGMNDALQKPLQLPLLQELLSKYLKLSDDKDNKNQIKKNVIFDKEELFSILSDERAMKHILQQFLTSHKNDCEIIKESIKAGNIAKVRSILHEIIGIAGNLYCCRLYEISLRFNAEIKSGMFVENTLSQFICVWKQTVGQLSECCNSLSAQYKQESCTEAEWEILRKDFYDLCNDFDMEATNLFNRNINAFAEHLSDSEFERIKYAVNQYDYLSLIEN